MKHSHSQRPSVRNLSTRGAIAKAIKAIENKSQEREKALVIENNKFAKSLHALQAPFEQLIAENPAAARALVELRRHRMKGPSGFARDLPVRDRPGESMMNIHLHQHLSFVIPPYDFDWQRGNPNDSLHNRFNGMIGILGESGNFSDGASGRVDAAAGIGLALTTDKPAFVSVRPYISYLWESVVAAAGPFSSGEARGGIDAAAFLNGGIIDGVRRSELFSYSRGWAGSERDDGGGVAWVPDVTLEFKMVPGQVVVVNYGAWVECDHSDGIGSGAGGAKVHGKVHWIVVERFVGP